MSGAKKTATINKLDEEIKSPEAITKTSMVWTSKSEIRALTQSNHTALALIRARQIAHNSSDEPAFFLN